MPTCFVIQPFDKGPFDKRYEDVFVPAITGASLDPYRVDRDPAAMIPVEEIEKGIRRADVCLADISLPNQNVWFELGFAISASKPVVMVCEHKPDSHYPFDVQHRAIITYRTESARDFDDLQKQITARLQAVISKENALEKIADSAVLANVEGLSPIEMMTLATVAQSTDGPDDWIPAWSVRQDMEKLGYTKIAVSLGLSSLLGKSMVETARRDDEYNNRYSVYQPTVTGMQWLITNQKRLVLRRDDESRPGPFVDGDDIPPF